MLVIWTSGNLHNSVTCILVDSLLHLMSPHIIQHHMVLTKALFFILIVLIDMSHTCSLFGKMCSRSKYANCTGLQNKSIALYRSWVQSEPHTFVFFNLSKCILLVHWTDHTFSYLTLCNLNCFELNPISTNYIT